MKASVGPIYGSGGFLSDVFFFSGRWAFNCGAYKWEGSLLEGGRGGLIIVCTFFQVGGPISLGLMSGSLW